ncbi:unnamed protein product [Cyclocybe aegerita]|uniref:pyranose dehydrogenase (acceptor) n=1 Tax=Cyclocybe aegerita TaxID=1973307 RepID=A0A8S0WVK8_CYCAE|nr:unnamed protein product [Cyclocybe aegerita]
MSSFPEAALSSLTKGLNAVVEKLNAGGADGLAASLKPTTRTLLSSAVLIVFLRLYLKKRQKKSKYVTNLSKVGKQVPAGQVNAQGLPEYDVIIVGGGTSGCALAARLSEDPNIHVLLLESGGSGRALPDSRTPASYTRLYANKEHVHSYYTEAQTSVDGKKKFWPRARMLGGCSSINAQMAQYGAPGDFDEWAAISGDDSWSWKNFAQYFRKFENYQPHPDYPLVDKSVKGTKGPVHIGYYNSVSGWCNYFIESCVAAGIPFTHDFNGPQGTNGVGRISKDQVFFDRSGINAQISDLLATDATVTRVIIDQTPGEQRRAIGVEFANTENGPRFQARVKKDVIISAGAVQSPQILLLSGVGPADHLKSKGVKVVEDLPGVGANLVDHPIVDMYFKQSGVVADFSFLRPGSISGIFKLFGALGQYYLLGRGGPLAMNWGESAAFIRTDNPTLFPPSEFPEKLIDSTSAKDSPDIEYFCTSTAYKDHGRIFFEGIHTFAIHAYLLRPTSHGHIRLNSLNPFAHPSVNPNYLSTHEDVAKLVRSVRLGLRITQQEPVRSHLDQNCTRPDLDHQLHLKSDKEIEALVRERVETAYHPTSTCRMAPLEQGGVVDSNLRVYGVQGLRVCDASVFPSIISGHTAGACFAVAEKLADDIKAEYAAARR